jgi:hypothetical protein
MPGFQVIGMIDRFDSLAKPEKNYDQVPHRARSRQ